MERTPPTFTERRIRQIFDQDKLLSLLGIELVDGRAGYVVLRYTVTNDVVQEHGTCHGGVIFSLADAACGIAASGDDFPAVTQMCSINFLKPVPVGAVLRATAIERSRTGRTVILDVTVVDSEGNTVAELRGTARSVRKRVFEKDMV